MPLVLRELLEGSRHYGQLRRGIPLIAPAMLSTRLRELVDAGVVERSPAGAGRWEYRLTEAGEEIRPIVRALGIGGSGGPSVSFGTSSWTPSSWSGSCAAG